MANESLGAAVLTLTTDNSQFFSGIDAAEKKKEGLRKSFDAMRGSAKGAGEDLGLFGKRLGETGSQSESLSGRLSGLGKALVATLSVGAVIGAIKSYADFTGQISDMSAKTGIGTEALQRLKYAAEQNGGSLEQVTKAVSKLGENLAGGNKNAVGALGALGLSFDTIRSMEPDKAFATIADSIAKIEDPMARSRLAVDLFGKSGAELLPMMTGNLSDTMKAADRLGIVMSDKAVKAGDEFGDTMASLTTVGQAVIAQVLEPFIPLLTTVAMWLGDNIPKALTGARGAFDWLIKKAMEIKLGFEQFVLGIVELGAKVPWLGEKLGATAETITSLRSSVQFSKDAIAAFDRQTQATGQTVTTAAGTLKTLNLNYADNEKATKAAAKAAQEKAEALDRIRYATIPLTAAQQQSVLEWQKLGTSASDMAKALGVNVVQVEQLVARLKIMDTDIATVHASTANFAALFPTQVRAGVEEITRMSIAMGVLREKIGSVYDIGSVLGHLVQEEIPPKFSTMRLRAEEAIAGITTSLSHNMAAALLHTQSFGDAFSNIWQGLKNTAVSLLGELLDHFVKNFLKGMLNSMMSAQGSFTQGFGGMLGGLKGVLGGMTTALSGWVGWAGAAIAGIAAAWKALSGLFGGGEEGTKVNPAREEWFAGRDVQDIGNALGAKGVDGETARQMIERVFQARTMKDFESARGAIDKILKGFAHGTMGRYLDFGKGTPVMLHGRERIMTEAEGRREASMAGRQPIVLEADGRVIARLVQRHWSSTLATQGVVT